MRPTHTRIADLHRQLALAHRMLALCEPSFTPEEWQSLLEEAERETQDAQGAAAGKAEAD
jgi:hypothetical protein